MNLRNLLIFTVLSASALAQSTTLLEQVSPESKIKLEVRNVASGKSTSNSYPTWWGSYDKSTAQSRDIEVSLHNLGKDDAEV